MRWLLDSRAPWLLSIAQLHILKAKKVYFNIFRFHDLNILINYYIEYFYPQVCDYKISGFIDVTAENFDVISFPIEKHLLGRYAC